MKSLKPLLLLLFIMHLGFSASLSAQQSEQDDFGNAPPTVVTVHVSNHQQLENCSNSQICLTATGQSMQCLTYNGTGIYVFYINGTGKGSVCPSQTNDCGITTHSTICYGGTWHWNQTVNVYLTITAQPPTD